MCISKNETSEHNVEKWEETNPKTSKHNAEEWCEETYACSS